MDNRNLGGRPKKLQLGLDSESVKAMLQNIWNEAEETKLKAINQYNKTARNMNELNDISLIGKINLDALKLVNDATEKKLSCVKIIQTYIQKDTAADASNSGPVVVSEEDKAAIRELFKQNSTTPEPPVKTIEENQKYEDTEVEKIIKEGQTPTDITDVPF